MSDRAKSAGTARAQSRGSSVRPKVSSRLEPEVGPQQRKIVGNYMIGKTIGEGTFGKVKLAVHLPSGEKVAIKILEKVKIKDQADIRRVNREIKILKKARHPNIIQLYEVLDTQNSIYLIMECAEGGEMFDYIVSHRYIEERQACSFFHQILDGVETLHLNDITHRDLKPENLLLKSSSSGWIIKIVDFGLSNTHEGGRYLHTACGSPCYAAPEMIAGQPYQGPIADMWSLGVILFAMVCGYLPFEDPNTSQLYRKILSGDYRTPKWISAEVKDLIGKILATDPKLRFRTADVRQHHWYQMVPTEEIPREDEDEDNSLVRNSNPLIQENNGSNWKENLGQNENNPSSMANSSENDDIKRRDSHIKPDGSVDQVESLRDWTCRALKEAGQDVSAILDGVASQACNSLTAMYYLFRQKGKNLRHRVRRKSGRSSIHSAHNNSRSNNNTVTNTTASSSNHSSGNSSHGSNTATAGTVIASSDNSGGEFEGPSTPLPSVVAVAGGSTTHAGHRKPSPSSHPTTAPYYQPPTILSPHGHIPHRPSLVDSNINSSANSSNPTANTHNGSGNGGGATPHSEGGGRSSIRQGTSAASGGGGGGGGVVVGSSAVAHSSRPRLRSGSGISNAPNTRRISGASNANNNATTTTNPNINVSMNTTTTTMTTANHVGSNSNAMTKNTVVSQTTHGVTGVPVLDLSALPQPILGVSNNGNQDQEDSYPTPHSVASANYSYHATGNSLASQPIYTSQTARPRTGGNANAANNPLVTRLYVAQPGNMDVPTTTTSSYPNGAPTIEDQSNKISFYPSNNASSNIATNNNINNNSNNNNNNSNSNNNSNPTGSDIAAAPSSSTTVDPGDVLPPFQDVERPTTRRSHLRSRGAPSTSVNPTGEFVDGTSHGGETSSVSRNSYPSNSPSGEENPAEGWIPLAPNEVEGAPVLLSDWNTSDSSKGKTSHSGGASASASASANASAATGAMNAPGSHPPSAAMVGGSLVQHAPTAPARSATSSHGSRRGKNIVEKTGEKSGASIDPTMTTTTGTTTTAISNPHAKSEALKNKIQAQGSLGPHGVLRINA